MKLGQKIFAASVLAASPFWLATGASAASQRPYAYAGYGYGYGPGYYGYNNPAYAPGYYTSGYAYDYPTALGGPYPWTCGYVGGPKTGDWACR
jgi:hypothetical protein